MRHPDTFAIDTLMLIDDSSFDQMIYRRIAQKTGLVQHLLQFLDAAEALAYLDDPETTDPVLILLDINMPGMDGFEFLQAATERFGVDLCPIVVMLTTSLHPRDEQRARSFPVVRDFLNKPLTKEQLHALAGLVDRGAQRGGDAA